jgi:hypothetical protein
VIHARQRSPRYIDVAQPLGGDAPAGMIAGIKLARRVLWIAFKKVEMVLSYVRYRTERLTVGYDNRSSRCHALAWQTSPEFCCNKNWIEASARSNVSRIYFIFLKLNSSQGGIMAANANGGTATVNATRQAIATFSVMAGTTLSSLLSDLLNSNQIVV